VLTTPYYFPLESSKTRIAEGMYFIEYMLEDVRITYRHDMKMELDDIIIDAKQGDISSLPRWIAKILVKQDIIEVQDNDISAYISRSLNRERIAKPHDLSSLDPNFYIRVNDYLEGLKENEREKFIVSLNSFVASRLQKIVKLAAASPLSPELKEKLSVEETELYRLIHIFSSFFRQEVLKKFG
jgi:DNA replication factor GINS